VKGTTKVLGLTVSNVEVGLLDTKHLEFYTHMYATIEHVIIVINNLIYSNIGVGSLLTFKKSNSAQSHTFCDIELNANLPCKGARL